MKQLITRFLRDESGQDTVEYVLIGVAVLTALVAAAPSLTTMLQTAITSLGTQIQAAITAA